MMAEAITNNDAEEKQIPTNAHCFVFVLRSSHKWKFHFMFGESMHNDYTSIRRE